MRDDEVVAPELPEDIRPEDLDIGARAQLKTLAKDNAEYVAKHMAMAARLIDEDPARAHEHALAAARRAGRIGVVRETVAITAYQLEDFALALRELRTYRRITGRDDQLPLMADCERGLGRPEKALELARSVDASTLETAVRVELAIVKSGARLDLGQQQAALEELRIPELRKDKAFEYSPALFASYAGVLEELGREEEAAEWFALADRAIDALEAALAPGELESVGIVTEHVETDGGGTLEEAGVALEPGAELHDAQSGERAAADDDTSDPSTGSDSSTSTAPGEADAAAQPSEPELPALTERSAVAEDAAAKDADARAADDAAELDEVASDAHSAPAVETNVAGEDDALFGDALFGDDMIERSDATDAERDDDAR